MQPQGPCLFSESTVILDNKLYGIGFWAEYD